jgi:hypothetical protein
MERSDNLELAAKISALLTRTAIAHRQYEIEALNGEVDQQWPQWYAAYLAENGLLDLLGGMAPANLELMLDELLIDCDKSHQSNAPEEKWQDYYARYMIQRVSKPGDRLEAGPVE